MSSASTARKAPAARRAPRATATLGAADIGLEARAQDDDHQAVKMWLRLLSCSTQIERSVRQHLRTRSGTTLPRFDYLAQLDRHPNGLRMNVLSSYLMVTGGNVTGLTDQLVAEGLVERTDDPDDRRSWRVRLTARGRADFSVMAVEHERWLIDLFSGVPAPVKAALYDSLGQLRLHLVQQQPAAAGSARPVSAPAPAPASTPRPRRPTP